MLIADKNGGRNMASSQFASVEVSPEMMLFVGSGEIPVAALPKNSAVLRIFLCTAPRVFIHAWASRASLAAQGASRYLTLIVMRDALQRLFSWAPDLQDGAEFHLPHDLAAIGERIWAEGNSPEVTQTYRLAKSIELLCDLVEAVQKDSLIPFYEGSVLSFGDSCRLLAARQMIDEQWSQKLTLDEIARRCGINRTKLSRGFRERFHCTVSEALADRRLEEARRQLMSTDLPIGVIGYRSGYSNNASFTRAFGRRFGVAPSDFRMASAAA